MKHVLLRSPSGPFSYPIFFEVDEGNDNKRRRGADPDDMTNEAFWRWLRQQN